MVKAGVIVVTAKNCITRLPIPLGTFVRYHNMPPIDTGMAKARMASTQYMLTS